MTQGGLLPARVAVSLRRDMPALMSDVMATVRSQVPEYADAMDAGVAKGLRWGVEHALQKFIDVAEGAQLTDTDAEVFRALGAAEWRDGRTLDALQSAYRVGARVSWRHFVTIGKGAGLRAMAMYQLAETIFAYIDEISAQSVRGYAAAQETAAGERERLRQQLVDLIFSAPKDLAAVSAVALRSGWRLPETVRIVAIGNETEPADVGLGLDALYSPEWRCFVVPARPSGPRGRDVLAAVGVPVAAGPEVPLLDADRSLRWAREALPIAAGAGATYAEDHVLELLLARGEDLLDALASRYLAPLEAMPLPVRVRILETLAIWLRLDRSATATASVLFVHPQTVRYRIGQVRDLLADVLDEPEARLGLQLAVEHRARQLRERC